MIYSHYSRLMAEAMDAGRPGPEPGQMQFLQKYLRRDAPNLDLACGTGRLLIPIQKLGYEVWGVDASPEMLECCRAKAGREGLDVNLSQQFMQTFTFDREFGLIFIADCTFDLLYTEEDRRAAVRNIKKHLRPGGVFLFDIETPPDPARLASGTAADWLSLDGGRRIIVSRKVFQHDPQTGQRPGVQIHDLYVDGRLVESQAYEDPMTFNNAHAVAALLEEEGFVDVRLGRYQSDEPMENTVGELVSIRCRRP
jgi:SAM-dependent methyltransferase